MLRLVPKWIDNDKYHIVTIRIRFAYVLQLLLSFVKAEIFNKMWTPISLFLLLHTQQSVYDVTRNHGNGDLIILGALHLNITHVTVFLRCGIGSGSGH